MGTTFTLHLCECHPATAPRQIPSFMTVATFQLWKAYDVSCLLLTARPVGQHRHWYDGEPFYVYHIDDFHQLIWNPPPEFTQVSADDLDSRDVTAWLPKLKGIDAYSKIVTNEWDGQRGSFMGVGLQRG